MAAIQTYRRHVTFHMRLWVTGIYILLHNDSNIFKDHKK